MHSFRGGVFLLVFSLAAVTLHAQEAPIWAPLPGDNRDRGTTNWTESPIKAEIQGYLRFGQGKAAASHVLVKLETTTGALFAQAWTGKLGDFIFDNIPCAAFVVVVDVPGFKPIRKEVEHSYVPTDGLTLYLIPDDGETSSATVELPPIPGNARKEFQKGLEAFAKKNADESIAHFRKATEIYPDYDDAYNQLAWVHVQQHAYAEAQRVLEKAIAVNSRNAGAYALLGSVYRAQNRVPESVRALERSLSLEEVSWFAHLELGQLLVKQGKVNDAYPHLVRAHQLNPVRALVHVELYNALILRNDNQAALKELEEFLSLFPNDPLAARVRQQEAKLKGAMQASLQQR